MSQTKLQNQQPIAIFLPSMRGGGAERAMWILAGGLAARGYSIDLVLAQAEGPNLSDVPTGVRVVDLGGHRMLRTLPSLVSYLRREKPQAMVSAMCYANLTAIWARWLARSSTRLIINEQTTISRPKSKTNWRRRMMISLVRRFYPWADCVVAVSDDLAADIHNVGRVRQEQIRTIYNPIIRGELKDLANEPIDDPWLAEDDSPIVLAVGRLCDAKDFPTLIRAFAEVHRARPARLLILGEGVNRPQLESLVEALNLTKTVRMPGFVDNPYAYMKRAALFVLSSVREGLPTVLIEAMYCGVPVVATDCPTGPREILRDGEFGRLVPVQDPHALAKAVNASLEDATPAADACRPYETETVVDDYLELLTSG